MAHYLSELNAVHPFREGNGRTQRIFISQLAKEYDIGFDWTKTTAREVLLASQEAMTGDPVRLAEILENCAVL